MSFPQEKENSKGEALEYFRAPLRLFLNFFGWIWTFFDRVNIRLLSLFVKPQYVRRGGCQRTGQCCKSIGIELPRSWLRRPRLVRLITGWHHLRYNFEFLGINENMLVYSCRYLTANNLCGIHRHKPRLCRDYPFFLWRGRPRLHKGCGYWFARRDGKDFESVMEKKKNQ